MAKKTTGTTKRKNVSKMDLARAIFRKYHDDDNVILESCTKTRKDICEIMKTKVDMTIAMAQNYYQRFRWEGFSEKS